MTNSTARSQMLRGGTWGVVIQGPSNHALEISKHYRCEDSVVSTWVGSEIPNGAVVLSKPPTWHGLRNVNNQKISTLAGLEALEAAGYEYSWKVRSDFAIHNINSLTDELISLSKAEHPKVWFLDWVLHKSGYPMDFIQFGRTSDLIKLWKNVNVFWPPFSSPEERVKAAFIKSFRSLHADKNAWKSIGFMASKVGQLVGVDIVWLKTGLSFSNDWLGNPVFVQSSGIRKTNNQATE